MSRLRRRLPTRLALLLCALAPLGAFAQSKGLEIDIVGGNAAALPIAVVPFGGNAGDTDIDDIVRADLARSGQFRTIGEAAMPQRPTSGSEVAYPTWRMLKQDFVLVGRSLPEGSGYRIEYELFDVAKQERLLGFALTAPAGAMRDVAHQISDAVYEKILGVPGAFWTRIAYVTASGLGRQSRYALMVADADGWNPRTVVNSTEPLMSPSWSPDGRRLAYVSFEGGNSGVYLQDIASGSREKVASFRGINGAPSFSPDGGRLALTLSKGGNPDIYVMDLGSKHLTQVTNHFGIDTEPTWSADGASIYFTSDRSGNPQIYRVASSGGSASRVTFQGNYNISPSISPDGHWLAYISRVGGGFKLYVMDLQTGTANAITDTTTDESPSFAPNSRLIVYATQQQGREALMTTTVDGKIKARLNGKNGDIREPDWGPYQKQ